MADCSTSSITLLVPGLLGTLEIYRQFKVLSGEQDCFQPLEQLLTHASTSPMGARGFEPTLFSLFAIAQDEEHDLPSAPLTLYADSGELPTGHWLRADPVYLQADRDRVLMTAAGRQDLSGESVCGFVDELNHFLQPLGLQLIAPVPQRWYLRLSRRPKMRTSPVNEVIGHDIHAHMPQGRDAQQWRALLNEIQMLLHASESNRRLQENSVTPVNSLWFWGGGSIPVSPGKSWDDVWGEDALMKGMARLTGARQQSLPKDAETWLASQPRNSKHLVVYDGMRSAAQLGDFDVWMKQASEFNHQWCKPLLQALKNKRITSVTIFPANGMKYEITKKNLGRWWKKHARLVSFLDRNDSRL